MMRDVLGYGLRLAGCPKPMPPILGARMMAVCLWIFGKKR